MTKKEIEDLGSAIFTELLAKYPNLDQLQLASILSYTGNFILHAVSSESDLRYNLRESSKFAYQILTIPPNLENAPLSEQSKTIALSGLNKGSSDSPSIQ